MIQTSNVSLAFGGRVLYKEVNLKFTKGNCYGIIGANGAGKSTFLKILTGELEPNTGEVIITPGERMSVLAQNQNAYDEETVLNTVLLGHKKLMDIQKEMDELYAKPDFSDEDGIRAGDLGVEFAELGGWEAESNAKTLLQGLGIDEEIYYTLMKDVDPKIKVKILLAQALFGYPDILILDEPTNNLDFKTAKWLEDFLLDFENIVIIVSHNRHFLNKVCTHICDVDFGQINMFLGNAMIDIILDWVILIIFLGVTAYDINKIKMLQEYEGIDQDKIHIYGAMQLYLDFINIFLRVLSLFGKRRD